MLRKALVIGIAVLLFGGVAWAKGGGGGHGGRSAAGRVTPQRATVVTRNVVINKTVTVNHVGGYGHSDHFWSNWMMFSMIHSAHRQPPVVVVSQPGQVVQTAPPPPESNSTPFIVALALAAILIPMIAWIVFFRKPE